MRKARKGGCLSKGGRRREKGVVAAVPTAERLRETDRVEETKVKEERER